MCGISCAVALRGHGPLDRNREKLSKILDESLDTIKHRGPDANGQWISENQQVGKGTASSEMNNIKTHVTDHFTLQLLATIV